MLTYERWTSSEVDPNGTINEENCFLDHIESRLLLLIFLYLFSILLGNKKHLGNIPSILDFSFVYVKTLSRFWLTIDEEGHDINVRKLPIDEIFLNNYIVLSTTIIDTKRSLKDVSEEYWFLTILVRVKTQRLLTYGRTFSCGENNIERRFNAFLVSRRQSDETTRQFLVFLTDVIRNEQLCASSRW